MKTDRHLGVKGNGSTGQTTIEERTGVQTGRYAEARDRKVALRYRLRRRTNEVIISIEKHLERLPGVLVDLGTAEGRMLQALSTRFPQTRCVGLEFAHELLVYGKRSLPSLNFIRGDAAVLPFKDSFVDVIVATAVIEHVPNPVRMVEETYRVLNKGGILVITTPAPFMEHLATMVGHLKDGKHMTLFTLRTLSDLITSHHFQVVEKRKFMLSPVGMPLETAFEGMLRSIKLDLIMANQLLVARK